MIALKEKILESARQSLSEKVNEMNGQLANIRADAGAGGKSSMGDKYETTREMLKQEEQKVATQLELCNKQLSIVMKQEVKAYDEVQAGSLIRSGNLYFMILTSIGKIRVADNDIFIVSAVAPISKLLLGKRVGDRFTFNRKELVIDELC
ncbi:MAG: hypothetical protein AAFQ94_22410 [Bacteroidota bacterium]